MNKFIAIKKSVSRGLVNVQTVQTSPVILITRRPNSASTNKDFAEAENSATPNEAGIDEMATIVPDVEKNALREQQMRANIEKMRDVSRFSKLNAEIKHRQLIPDLSNHKKAEELENSPRYFRRLYARLGRNSGVEPGLAWPPKSELQQIIADEKQFDLTLEKKIQILIERKTNEINEHQKLINETTNSLMKMPKMVDGYFERLQKRFKQTEKKAKKKNEFEGSQKDKQNRVEKK